MGRPNPARVAMRRRSQYRSRPQPATGGLPMGLHREPDIAKQCVVVVGEDCVPIELVVIGVLQTDAHISPRPPWRLAGNEGDVGDLEDVAVAVWTTSASRVVRIQSRV